MTIVYQILEMAITESQNTYVVKLQHIIKKEAVCGTIIIRHKSGKESMWFRKEGDSREYEVVGKYDKHNDITFFHSGETQYVYLHDEKCLNLYVDVVEVEKDPLDGKLKVADIIIIDYGEAQSCT